MKLIDKKRARKITAEGYGRVAELWDRYWVPAYSPARKRLFSLALLEHGEEVLDVGTGTGVAAVIASGLVGTTGSVLAVDNSGRMLAVARAKALKLGLKNIRFRLAGLASLRLPEESLDAVISSYGMPDLASDYGKVLPMLFRALKPGGRLCLCERADKPQEPDVLVKRLLDSYRTAYADSKLKARRRLEELAIEEVKQLSHPYQTDALSIRKAVETAGFRRVRAFKEIFRVKFPSPAVYIDVELSCWSLFGDEYAAMSPDFQQEFMGEVLRALRRFRSPNGLTWDAGVNFCVARK